MGVKSKIKIIYWIILPDTSRGSSYVHIIKHGKFPTGVIVQFRWLVSDRYFSAILLKFCTDPQQMLGYFWNLTDLLATATDGV